IATMAMRVCEVRVDKLRVYAVYVSCSNRGWGLRRTHVDPNLLNDFEEIKMAANGNDDNQPPPEGGDLPVPDFQTMEVLCQPTSNGRGGPIAPVAIQATNFGLKNDMIQQVQNSCQFHGLSSDDANKHLDKFLHVTQSIKVNEVTDDALLLQINQQVKAATPSCETCGGPHPYNDCLATVGHTQNVYVAGAYNQGGNSYQPQGFKMEFFKGKTYDQILPIFQARFDANLKFLFKTREEMEKEDKEIIKSINETPSQKVAKRRKLNEEAQEADNLRRRLEIVPNKDDDVFIEAVPLAQKAPVVDYQVLVVDKRPKYKIIRADDTHQFYISFTTLLKNLDREDLEALWRIVKDRFSLKKPTNFSDEYLLLTLKTMFGELDEQDAI
nr:reverse transcriptase domain-containing protein [Tanacetum cinerariifolium]